MKKDNMLQEKRSRHTNLAAALLLSVTLLLASCYPQGPEVVSDYDVVGTSFDSTFNFRGVRTYALLDTVMVMQGNNNNNTRRYLNPNLNTFMISRVENNLNRLGYSRITTISRDNIPDVVIQVTAFSNTTVGAYYDTWYNNWGGYPGWNSWSGGGFGPGWGAGFGPGWGPGWGPVITQYYSVTTGSVLLEMINPRGVDNNAQRLPVVWIGALNGILDFADNASNRERIANGIDQAFMQSPYLGRSM
jgi:hypothetical protein